MSCVFILDKDLKSTLLVEKYSTKLEVDKSLKLCKKEIN